MAIEVFGDIVLQEGNEISFSTLKKILERPIIHPIYRLNVLTPTELVDYTIPMSDIVQNSIQYTENYQNGQRRNLSVQLINTNKRYTPSKNGIWINTKFSFEIGLRYNGKLFWFPKGIYTLGNVDLVRNNSEKTVTYQLQDKFAIFEGKQEP